MVRMRKSASFDYKKKGYGGPPDPNPYAIMARLIGMIEKERSVTHEFIKQEIAELSGMMELLLKELKK